MWKYILIIFLLGFLLRIVSLSSYPSGFTPDEASFGYDSYSILKTGKDQWGRFMPLSLESFGDFKLPLYSYLSIPFVFIFGLTEFSTRLAGAIFGSFAVVILYFLTKELTGSRKTAIVASLFLAISPWHIMLSRGAFEANLITFFIPATILSFIYAENNSKKYYLLSLFLFILSIYSYHSARILTPLIVLLFVAWKIIIKKRKIFMDKYFLVFIFILLTMTVIAFAGYFGTSSRLNSSSYLSWALDEPQRRFDLLVGGTPTLLLKVFQNPVLAFVSRFAKQYLSYFSFEFLFTQGPNEATYGMVPGIGLLWIVEIIFLIGFVFKLIKDFVKGKFNIKYSILILSLLLSPIPGALTVGPGHAANRVVLMDIFLVIFSSIGFIYIFDNIYKLKYIRNIFFVIIISVFSFQFLNFFESYVFIQPIRYQSSMIYGMDSLFEKISKYDGMNIIVSRKISEPHIYYLFYRKIDPLFAQSAANTSWFKYRTETSGWVDQLSDYSIGNYAFKSFDLKNEKPEENTVYVGFPEDFPKDIVPNEVVNYQNGNSAYYIVKI